MSTTRKIDYHCKFCGTPGSVTFEFSAECEAMFSIDVWLKALCCNRCADYRVNARTAVDRIKRTCAAFLTVKGTKQQTAAENATRSKLVQLTGDLARVVCDHHGVERVYDEAFADMLMDRPDYCMVVCRKYISGLVQIAKEAHTPPPPPQQELATT